MVTLGARLCVDFADIEADLEADIEAEIKLDVVVEFSTRMCGE